MQVNGPLPIPIQMHGRLGAGQASAAKGTPDSANAPDTRPEAMLDAKLAHFWEGMLDTMEERSGVVGIKHDRDRDLSYLASKSRALHTEFNRMPDGPDKRAVLDKLDHFVQDNTKRIENNYQRAMARETGSAPLDEKAFAVKMRMRDLV